MTGVLKSTAVPDGLRSLAATLRQPLTIVEPDPRAPDPFAPLYAEISDLTSALADRDAEIAGLKRDVERAFEEGEVLGRDKGFGEAEDRQHERLSGLEAGIEAALDRFRSELRDLENLAAQIAHEGLRKIVENPEKHTDLLAGALRLQLGQLEARSILHIEVASEDFSDAAQLTALCDAVSRPDIEVRTSGDLKTGECRINLRLGALEVGVGSQWKKLSAVLQVLTPSPEAAE